MNAPSGHSHLETDIAEPNMGTVSTVYLRSYFQTCVDNGCPREPLLELIGLGPEPFNNPTRRFDNDIVIDMLHLAEKLTGDTRLGFHAGMAFRPATFLDTSLISCPTLREAIDFNERYQRLTQELGKTRLIVAGDEARLIWRPFCEDPEYIRPITEAVFAGYAAIGRWLTWLHNQNVIAMRFRHQKNANTEFAESVFGCKVTYGAELDVMAFEASLADLPLPQSNPELLEILRVRLDEQLEALDRPATMQSQTYQCIQTLIKRGAPNAAEVAAALGVSERSLRRRLAAEGESFRGVLEAVRRDMCEVYMRNTSTSIGEIAHALGYSEQSAFARAYRKWFGAAPSKHKAAH